MLVIKVIEEGREIVEINANHRYGTAMGRSSVVVVPHRDSRGVGGGCWRKRVTADRKLFHC